MRKIVSLLIVHDTLHEWWFKYCWNQQKKQQQQQQQAVVKQQCATVQYCWCCCYLFHIRFIFMQIKWNSDQFGKVICGCETWNWRYHDRCDSGSLIAPQLNFENRQSYAYDLPSNFLFTAVYSKWQRLTVQRARACVYMCEWELICKRRTWLLLTWTWTGLK